MKTESTAFLEDSAKVAADVPLRDFLRGALGRYGTTRKGTEERFGDWNAAREAAAAIKWEAIEHLDRHLENFADNLAKRGVQVHWAPSGAEARDIILGILRKRGARSIVKSKCMTTEEIHLNDLLEKEGFGVVEGGHRAPTGRGDGPPLTRTVCAAREQR